MKAKYKDKHSRYILSIGMIVKNEEKNLRSCLEALEPLREAVPSELIIVDTGSEDATVEIAQEYTDKVYFYEWNKDFAAARNYGLDRASGQWFMFIDADEQLASPDELISFFNSNELKKYNTASITIHSFLDKEHIQYSDFTSTRIFRVGNGNRFFGRIHEVPMNIKPAKKLLQTRLDHTGYIYETVEDMKRKSQRNNELLEVELEKNPDDLRWICLYAASCPREKRRELLEHGREIAKENPEHHYFPETYWKLSRILLQEGAYEEIVDLAEEYKALTTMDHVGEIELVYNLTEAYFQLNQYEAQLAAAERYIELYHRYIDGSLIESDTGSTVCERGSPKVFATIFPQIAGALLNLGRYEEAFETLLKTDLDLLVDKDSQLLVVFLKILGNSGRYDWLIKADEWVRSFELSDERTDVFVKNFVDVYLQKVDTPDFSMELPESDSVFANMIRAGAGDEASEWERMLLQLEEDEVKGERYGVIAFYYALKKQKSLSPLLHNMNRETIQKWNYRLAEQLSGLEKVLIQYPVKREEQDIFTRSWLIDLENRVLESCEEEYCLPLFHRIAEDLSWYINRVYNREILTPEGISILPSGHRFAYWCGQALEAKTQGDISGYIRLLGEASRTCPEMAKVVKLLVQEVRDNDEALKAQREQQELAKKIKGIIEGMILAGNQADAQSILAQYELIAPGDPDIPALKAAILQQPSLTEI